MYETLALLGAFTLLYSVVAGRVQRTWISGPILFMAFGLLIGPVGLGWLSFKSDPELLKSMAELTLALVLFTDASGTDLKVLRRIEVMPIRLLAIGLPLTILLGFGAGKLMFGALTLFEIALIATMLAPTDAALGQAVVTNEAVPNPVRQGLNVESGLNDGICVPILFLFLALAGAHGGDETPWHMGLRLFAEAVGIGVLTGVVLTGVTVSLLLLCAKRGWMSSWTNITVIALAFTCFGTAQSLGGSGFIASFTGGLLFAGLVKQHRQELVDAAEGIGDAFSLLTWTLFGAAVVGQAWGYFSWPVVLYAVLSLTVIRMLPVFLVVAGLGMDTETKLFIGWFGPRGLASVVFVVIVGGAGMPHMETIAAVVSCTVILSILLHGVTANPWARAYGARMRQAGQAASTNH